MSCGLLFHSPDRQVSLDGPGRCHQAGYGDSRASDEGKVRVPFRAGCGLVQEVGPGQEEQGR